MSNITIPNNFGPLPSIFQGHNHSNQDELGAGISSGFGVLGYRGKVWSTKYQGNETPLLRDDGDGARASIEVVIVKSAASIAKIFYKGGYVDGSNAAPDCWSTNGVTPDASVQNKVSTSCANCPMAAWGSRITESGKPNKACSDSKRLAVVPLNDIANELMGGPMLLRVPAASLKDLKSYGDKLGANGFPYYAVGTRIAFDVNEAFPKFVFTPIRPLTEAEAKQIVALREDIRVHRILNESTENAAAQAQPEGIMFEQPAPAATPKVTPKAEAPKAEAPKAAAPAPAPAAPKADDAKAKAVAAAKAKAEAARLAAEAAAAAAAAAEAEEEGADPDTGEIPMGTAPKSFDDMLDSLLPK